MPDHHHDHHHHGHHHGGHSRPGHEGHHGEGLAELLDLDAEVMRDLQREIVAWVRGQAPDAGTLIDLGAGTGAGTLELLAQYPQARATAVDADPQMLARLRHKAADRGVADRIAAVEADLDRGWPDGLPPADLVWATNSMHHLADPPAVLAAIRKALAPGGTLAVVELEHFPRFLPEDVGLGEPGLESRIHAAMDRARAEDMPHLGDDWGATLTEAGFTVRAERRFEATLTPLLPPRAAHYARLSLARTHETLAAVLLPADLATLEALLDEAGPHSILHREDLTIRTSRLAWLAE